MAFADSTRINPEKRLMMKQIETGKRERCRNCIYPPPKLEDSWAEPDRTCDHKREFHIGRRKCWGRKDYGSAA